MKTTATTIVMTLLCLSVQAQEVTLSQDNQGRTFIEDTRTGNQAYQPGKMMSGASFADHIEDTFQPTGFKVGGDDWTGESFLRGAGVQAAGDVDGDGQADFVQTRANIPDLSTADLEDRTSFSYLYLGDLSTFSQTFEGVSNIFPVGDINGDGFNDALFVKDLNNNELHLYTGSSSGYTDASQSYSFTEPVVDVISGDFNRDGVDDVVIRDEATVLHNLKGNTNGTADISLNEMSSVPNLAFLRSFEQNQEDYLIIAINEESNFTVRIGSIDSSDEFIMDQSIYIDGSASDIEAMDIDGDGNLDLVYSQNGTVFGYMHETDPATIFQTSATIFGTVGAPYSIVSFVPDMTGDGSADLLLRSDNPRYLYNGAELVTNGYSEANHIEIGDASQPYTRYSLAENRTSPSAMRNEFGDITGDGNTDLIMGIDNAPGDVTVNAVSTIATGSATETNLNAPTFEVGHETIYTNNAGDWDADGIDDFGYIYNTFRSEGSYYQIDLSGGGNLKFELGSESNFFRVPEFADLDGDGSNEMLLTMNAFENDALVEYVAIYSASSSTPTEKVYFEKLTDIFTDATNPRINKFVNVGDVTGDGQENVVATTGGELFNADKMYLVSDVGGSYQYNQINSAGNFAANIGDINQDGIDDFAVNHVFGNEIRFFHGVQNPGAAETFTKVDEIAQADVQDYTSSSLFFFAFRFATGDFTGDGNLDIVATPFTSNESQGSDEGGEMIFLFEGYDDGSIETVVPSQAIKVSTDNMDPLGNTYGPDVEYMDLIGAIQTLPDVNGDGSDELLVTSQIGSNAMVMMGGSYVSFNVDEPGNPEVQLPATFLSDTSYLLEAPNRTTRLGLGANFTNATYSNAAGDFNDDGVMEVVLPQPFDGNYQVTPSYNYELGIPAYEEPTVLELASVEDVENDQGGWVRVNIGGVVVDENDYQSWSIFRKDADENWVHVQSIPYTTNAAAYAEVAVPHTLPTGATPDETNSYDFKVTMDVVLELGEYEDVVTIVTDEVTGWALDNLAPSKVDGFEGVLDGNEVVLTWSGSSANDLKQYQVFEVINGNFDAENPLLTSTETSATVSTEELGTTTANARFVVKAVDIHNNAGEVSDQIEVDISTSNDELSMELPTDYDLKQNYPNPFNPSTNIRFDLPESADVNIAVYNLLGERVATLVNRTMNAGQHVVEFNANRLSSGTYIYRMQTSTGFTQTQKLTLIK